MLPPCLLASSIASPACLKPTPSQDDPGSNDTVVATPPYFQGVPGLPGNYSYFGARRNWAVVSVYLLRLPTVNLAAQPFRPTSPNPNLVANS